MTTKTKKLAALLMSGIMTLSIAPVVHADDKVELTGMVQQSRWYSGLQSMVEKLEIFLSNLKLFQMTSMIT